MSRLWFVNATPAGVRPAGGFSWGCELADILQHFRFAHLPPHLQEISRDFAELARKTHQRAPGDPETAVALRKLLEAKDAAVRAALSGVPAEDTGQRVSIDDPVRPPRHDRGTVEAA